jgi:uncharacterized phiE125 gp8 family phage protein
MDFYKNADKWSNYNGPLSYNQITDYTKGTVTEEITLSEVKEFCKVSTSSDDALLTALITAAREVCENYTNRSFGEREMIAWIDNNNGSTYLPFGPVVEITKVSDIDGVEITDFKTKGSSFVQILSPTKILKIEYIAGISLEEVFKTAIKSQILFMYENRGDAQLDTLQGTSPIAQVILNPYRRV